MIEWFDSAIMLSVRRHGETAAIVCLLTREHGPFRGLLHGGASRKRRPLIEIGNHVAVKWKARLPEHLGSVSLELERAVARRFIDDPARLACLASACAVAEVAFPERQPCQHQYDALVVLLDQLASDSAHWPAVYVRWEIGVLAELGYGLELTRCAVTGEREGLAWVSPRTGRAVTHAAGEKWADRLLVLPGFLAGRREATLSDVLDGLRMTGYFLSRYLRPEQEPATPPARTRFMDCLVRRNETELQDHHG